MHRAAIKSLLFMLDTAYNLIGFAFSHLMQLLMRLFASAVLLNWFSLIDLRYLNERILNYGLMWHGIKLGSLISLYYKGTHWKILIFMLDLRPPMFSKFSILPVRLLAIWTDMMAQLFENQKLFQMVMRNQGIHLKFVTYYFYKIQITIPLFSLISNNLIDNA